MKIYTRTGDSGSTSLLNGERVKKSSLQIEACGTLDELTSFLGLTITKVKNTNDRQLLTNIQKNIYRLISMVAGKKNQKEPLKKMVNFIEQKIDINLLKLTKINSFILPGGTELSGWFHVLRVVCRRAERQVVACGNQQEIIPYLNRLSDLFFVLARKYNRNKEEFLGKTRH